MKTNSFIAAMLASLVSCMAASTAFAEPIGAAVRIVNKVTGEIDQRQRALKANDPVNQNEAIEVAADSLGELKLNDDTKLALGPGSRMVLDKFVYDPAPSTGTVSVNLLTGAFRFITGLSRKGNYQLRTPSASITVRGTVFDIYVDGAGGTWLLLLEGSVRVCNAANQCADVDNPCGVVHITPTGTLDGPLGWPAQTRPINFATAFPFVVTPPSIDATPLFTRTAVELNQCAKKPATQQAQAPAQTPTTTTPAKPTTPAYTPPPPAPPSYDTTEASEPYTPVTPPPVIVSRSFTGAYVGANIGYGFSTSNTNVSCVSPPGALQFLGELLRGDHQRRLRDRVRPVTERCDGRSAGRLRLPLRQCGARVRHRHVDQRHGRQRLGRDCGPDIRARVQPRGREHQMARHAAQPARLRQQRHAVLRDRRLGLRPGGDEL